MSLYKIGDISKLCNISIKTLRYYEELDLIKPAQVDVYTGYRYYDQKNVEQIYFIQLLKNLNFSLDEIKNFSKGSLGEKYTQIKKDIKELKKKLELISSLQIQKGEGIMKCFVNDERVVGKWKYECSATSIESYLKGDFYNDKDCYLKELYFLPDGDGYWFIDRWTKDYIFTYDGKIVKYLLENEKLYYQETDENGEVEYVLVFSQIDDKEYCEKDIKRKDNVDMPFRYNEHAVGYWEAVDFIDYKDKKYYKPRKNENDLFVKSLSLTPNGDCFKEFKDGEISKIKWTDKYILNKNNNTVSEFILKRIGSDDYLIQDWKSGDYIYGGYIAGCYVFKKIKNDEDSKNHEM